MERHRYAIPFMLATLCMVGLLSYTYQIMPKKGAATMNWASLYMNTPLGKRKSQTPQPSTPTAEVSRILFIVTPSAQVFTQSANLIRLSHVLRLVPMHIHWILIEDANETSKAARTILNRSGLEYTHLAVASPAKRPIGLHGPHLRGMIQRNAGLEVIHKYAQTLDDTKLDGVVYFADDDNTYTVELFEFMRHIKKVGIWGVGYAGGLDVEHPIVDENNKVVGWNTLWRDNRTFPVDMAGFAVNLDLFLSHTTTRFNPAGKPGHGETDLLESLGVTKDELEVFGVREKQVRVWHTKTVIENEAQTDENKKNILSWNV